MQHQKRIVEQASAWLTFVQKAVDNHVMGLADLQEPQAMLEKEQKRLHSTENTMPH